ncbi:serine/threonine dehydratase [Nocardia thailandica]|uniref:Serine/threonine dehydratase n=1 Tax=Nocardia thailandica TaxID=257275 RepID=A0ABW6PPB2_9NOCA|nr:serine/threonine dehydratase [Nocardia thailandica]
MPFTYADVEQAAHRIAGRIRPLSTARADPAGPVFFALEFLQFTGTFKARGAQNFVRAHAETGALPAAGLTIASGGNAGLACAWAAASAGVPATVFLPETAPPVKIARLRELGAEVRFGRDYPAAAAACREFAAASGALASHAYDHPLIAAGAGTLTRELLAAVPGIDTVLVAVGGGGLFAGTAVAARHHGVRTVAVEPKGCATLHAALAAGAPVEVPVDSVAADSLGAPIVSQTAYELATDPSVSSVVLDDEAIVTARRALWDRHRIAVEHGAATAYAALLDGPDGPAYRPAADERVAVILCGANTDPATLTG